MRLGGTAKPTFDRAADIRPRQPFISDQTSRKEAS
jgi:hypothetical protein